MYPEYLRGNLLHDLCIGYRICRRCLICPDQSRDSQLYAAEIPYDHHQNVAQPVRVYLSEHRPAGRSRRFSVVIRTELVALISQAVCIYMMPRVVVLLLECSDDFLHFFFCFNGICMGNESASIVLEKTTRFFRYALVRILDLSVVHTENQN